MSEIDSSANNGSKGPKPVISFTIPFDKEMSSSLFNFNFSSFANALTISKTLVVRRPPSEPSKLFRSNSSISRRCSLNFISIKGSRSPTTAFSFEGNGLGVSASTAAISSRWSIVDFTSLGRDSLSFKYVEKRPI